MIAFQLEFSYLLNQRIHYLYSLILKNFQCVTENHLNLCHCFSFITRIRYYLNLYYLNYYVHLFILFLIRLKFFTKFLFHFHWMCLVNLINLKHINCVIQIL